MRQHKKVGHSSGISIISQNKPLNCLENYGKIHGIKGTAHIGGNKAWKTEVAKVVAGIASTALGAFLMIHHDRFWAICSAGGVQVFDDRYRDGKMIYKDYGKKSV